MTTAITIIGGIVLGGMIFAGGWFFVIRPHQLTAEDIATLRMLERWRNGK